MSKRELARVEVLARVRSKELRVVDAGRLMQVSYFAKDGGRGHDIDAVDPGQVRTAHAKQPLAQIELWRIPLLLPASSLALFFRQKGTLAPILSLLEILFELAIALGYLLLAKLVTILFLLQHKQQIWLPVAFQTLRNLLLARLHPKISQRSQLLGIAFAS